MSSRRSDSVQLTRQWAVLRLLSESGRAFSVKELADQLGVSKSTIKRDLATLEKDFALVEEEAGRQKRVYRIDQNLKALEAIKFGTTELLAIHAAVNALGSLGGTPIHEDLRVVASKLRGYLSPRHNGGLDAMSRVFQQHSRNYVDYGDSAETIDELVDAISRRRVCEVTYFAAWRGTTRTHRIRPLRLVWHRSAIYLMACLVGRQNITTFAVHRIRDLRVTDEVFADPRVDLAEHAERAFGIFVSDEEVDVEVLFAPSIAWRVQERVFHPAEMKESLEDGSLRYRIRTSAQWEIIPWVLQFGGLAELVQPVPWRNQLQAAASEIASGHV